MKDSNLISLLKTFSADEINRFEKFLLSPYFTEGKKLRSHIVVEYFSQLKRFYPRFDGKDFSREYLYKELYQGKKFKDNVLRKINSDLFKLTEKFLIQQELEDNKIESRKFLLSQLTKRNQEKLFKKCFDSMLKYLNGLERDEEYFYETYYIFKRYWYFYYGKKSFYKLEDTVVNINNYFIYVILGALRIYLWAIAYLRIINRNNDFMMYEEILSYVEKNTRQFDKIPQILFYYNLIRLFSGKGEQYFIKLKELKPRHFGSLTDLDKQNFFIMMTNYCNDMIQSGNEKFKRERFELDKEYLNLIKKLNLHPVHVFYLLAASKNANRLGEFDWVKKILVDIEYFIIDDNKDFMINYINADICFLKHKYDEALDLLSRINTNYSNQKQYVRNLIIQIFYEISESDSALSLIDSSKHFLKRDKHLNENSKLLFLNFIKFTEKLILLNNNSEKNQLQFLKKNILENSVIINKDWLLEKLSLLESLK